MPLYASFAIPAGLLMWHKRSEVFLPRDRVFRLGPKVGYFCNAVTIVFAVFINIFFVFPATLPVQASNMSESLTCCCRRVMPERLKLIVVFRLITLFLLRRLQL